MRNNRVHVIYRGKKGWAVKRENKLRASMLCSSKTLASLEALPMSIKTNSDLVIHNKDGTVKHYYDLAEPSKRKEA